MHSIRRGLATEDAAREEFPRFVSLSVTRRTLRNCTECHLRLTRKCARRIFLHKR